MSSAPVPRIAVNGLLVNEDGPRVQLRLRYAEAVLAAGGLPLAIPPVGDAGAYLDGVDGLFLTGGDDFTTERLGLGPTHPEADPVPVEKQDWDVELARAALREGVPVLGVCYGMQLLALIDGAGLHQHLPEELPGRRDHRGGVRHDVRIDAGTKLERALGVDRLQVVSRHHQALSSVAGPWRVCASDDEGTIEGVEHVEHPFALGVQWHPELSPDGHPDTRLFRALVQAAARHAERRRSRTQTIAP